MKKISIHFGLNRVGPQFYGGWAGYLAGCINDAQDLAELSARAGMQARALFDEDCTIERFSAEAANAATELGDGDECVISYSGHGSTDDSFGSLDRQSICLFNGELADSTLRSLIADFNPGTRVVFIFDSCHSGGMVRDRSIIRAKPSFVKATRKIRAEPVELQGAVLFLTASSAQETSLDGDKNGAYTGALLDTMEKFESQGKHPTWQEWHNAVVRYMSINFAGQHPQMEEVGRLSIAHSEVFTFETKPLIA